MERGEIRNVIRWREGISKSAFLQPKGRKRYNRQLREIGKASNNTEATPRKPGRATGSGSTVWTGMGYRGASNPTPSPTPVVITVLACFAVWGIGCVQGCPFGNCWNLYQLSLQDLSVPDEDPLSEPQRNSKCIALRTLVHCLENITRQCLQDMNFRTAKHMAGRHLNKYKCSKEGPTHIPPPHRRPSIDPRVCSYEGERVYKHCALFGDPHLRTFRDNFQTCRVQGAWPLINNDYFIVQVTNAKVVDEGQATATNMLTVMIKRNYKCGADRYYLYQASSDSLPGTFSDGSTYFGPENSVQINEVVENKHVEIYMRFIDTTIVVRQVGRYFTFAIKMPEEFVNQSLSNPNSMELCSKGCPNTEQIDLKEVLAQRRQHFSSNLQTTQLAMSQREAVQQCQKAQVVDFYFDSCVFDLMTTGDTNFTFAAYNALRDMLRLDPDSGSNRKNRTNLPPSYHILPTAGSSGNSLQNMQYKFSYILMALCTLLVCWNRLLGVFTNHQTYL